MQIGNNYSPNFGMALKIKKTPEVINQLKQQPMEYVNHLRDVGTQLKDCSKYHVEIQENLRPRLVSEEGAYYGGGIKNGNIKFVNYGKANEHVQIGDNCDVFILNGGKKAEGSEFVEYNVQKNGQPLNLRDDVGDVAKIAVKLDENAKNREIFVSEQAAERAKVSEAVDKLLDEFA